AKAPTPSNPASRTRTWQCLRGRMGKQPRGGQSGLTTLKLGTRRGNVKQIFPGRPDFSAARQVEVLRARRAILPCDTGAGVPLPLRAKEELAGVPARHDRPEMYS